VTGTRGGWALRIGLLAVTVAVAMVAFSSGVGASERAGIPEAGALTHAYYTLGLFVLGGLDIGTPSGGPPALRYAMWAVYFLAPLITTTAVVESAIRVLRPDWVRRMALRDHVVVVGMGRLGMMFVEALRARDPRARVLLVAREGLAGNAQVAAARFRAVTLQGDVRNDATMDAMNLEQARALVMLTGDDLMNLEVGWQAKRRAPGVRVVAHIGDIGMRRLVDRSRCGDGAAAGVRVFNSHRVAARGLLEEHLDEIFAATAPRDVVVIAGFGRFGQTILEHLLNEADEELAYAVVVDVAAEHRVRAFRSQVDGTAGCEIVCVQGDLDDPKTWEDVEAALAGLDVQPVYVVCTDEDGRNLRAAIGLRRARADAPIFVRCVYRSAFTGELSDELDFSVLSVEDMLRQTMRDRVDEWVGPPTR